MQVFLCFFICNHLIFFVIFVPEQKNNKMKRIIIVVFIMSLVFSTNAQRSKKNKLENNLDSLSYAIGVSFGSSIKSQQIKEIDIDKLALALNDILESNELKISLHESQEFLRNYMANLKERVKQENLDMANNFLEENKKREGVIEIKDGLQYEVIREGSGKSPKLKSRVKTHYEGTLLDGTVFDSSYQRNEPITFGVGEVIDGWKEALQVMKPGAKWKLYIHPDLGYKERGTGNIPPNSLLIFEIELLSIEK